MQTFTRIDTFLSWTQATLSTSAAVILSSSNTLRGIQSVILTNNDGSATVYVGPGSGVTSTNFVWSLAPGATQKIDVGQGAAEQLYAVASTGTPKLSVAVGQ